MVPNSISGRRKEKRRRKGRRRRRKKEKKEGEEEKKEEKKKKEKESAGERKKKEKDKEKEKKREGRKEGKKKERKRRKKRWEGGHASAINANQEGGGLSDKGNAKQVTKPVKLSLGPNRIGNSQIGSRCREDVAPAMAPLEMVPTTATF
ncbi:hypothetical protein PVK06_025455 [Gossypium arboreum]|uniref:Uncharacterized protein n=1 Tax=Gossypium arboreum TaxID=29729 RepID=A0ABR0PGR3_GOSAR|nr:hypothetical protein PVK06_025455 [Gossypium arboreum]